VRWRSWVLALVGIIALILAVDWTMAKARVRGISIEASLEPESVVADGKSTTVISVCVTENGEPRAHDLLQAWLATGSGQVLPAWMYTDEEGKAVIKVTPNRYTPYDPQDKLELVILDTSIGNLVEVGARKTVDIFVSKP